MTHLLKQLEKENNNKSEENLKKALHLEVEYIRGLVHKYMPNLEIYRIEKANNNFLEGMYQLTKAEHVSRWGCCTEKNIFHVTAAENVDSIIRDNLDWRRGDKKYHLSSGIYFSDDADMANRMCNTTVGRDRAMIVCKVIVGTSSKLPNGIDTNDCEGKIYVKYGDNEFLPNFVVFYNYPERN